MTVIYATAVNVSTFCDFNLTTHERRSQNPVLLFFVTYYTKVSIYSFTKGKINESSFIGLFHSNARQSV
jgi:hypothetical protein